MAVNSGQKEERKKPRLSKGFCTYLTGNNQHHCTDVTDLNGYIIIIMDT